MTAKRLGRQTVALSDPVSVLSFANIGGKQEARGPLAGYFDELNPDAYFGQKSWEKGESAMQQFALSRAMEKGGIIAEEVDCVLAGDLLNQCIGTSFGLRDFKIPFYGLYGACSTMGESLSLAALLIDGGFASIVAAMTSSHFCTAERQYRMPVLYGNQRTPTAQWTATASGCCILSRRGDGPYITHVTCGRIVDLGIKDANNMGAAMAPAAYDTLSAVLRETHTTPEDYDLILTGDLGELGRDIVADFFGRTESTWADATPTAACCSMTGRSRICTPGPPAAAARRRCSAAMSWEECGPAAGKRSSLPLPGRCSRPPRPFRGRAFPASATRW